MKWLLGIFGRVRPSFEEGGKLGALKPVFDEHGKLGGHGLMSILYYAVSQADNGLLGRHCRRDKGDATIRTDLANLLHLGQRRRVGGKQVAETDGVWGQALMHIQQRQCIAGANRPYNYHCSII